MTDNDDPADDGMEDSTFESGHEERQAHYPDTGYNLVEINLTRPPGDALARRSHHLTLSSIILPPATDFEEYVVYDQYGHAYDHDDLQNPSEAAATTDIDGLIETIRTADGKAKRLAVLRLAHISNADPGAGLRPSPH
jgi:hypothetical protein